MLDILLRFVAVVVVTLLAAGITSLLLISLLRGEPIPWRLYWRYFLGERPRGW